MVEDIKLTLMLHEEDVEACTPIPGSVVDADYFQGIHSRASRASFQVLRDPPHSKPRCQQEIDPDFLACQVLDGAQLRTGSQPEPYGHPSGCGETRDCQ